MIGRLRGTLLFKQPPALVVEAHGVGYELDAPMSTFYDLPAVGQEVFLFTHYAVKEDSAALYGFLSDAERALFRILLKVSGIGAKTALAILSGVGTDEFARLVQIADIAALTRVPGIGKKTAERIVVELRDRVGAGGGSLPQGVGGREIPQDPAAEAAIALQALGYKPAEVSHLVGKVAAPGDGAETIIRKALAAALK